HAPPPPTPRPGPHPPTTPPTRRPQPHETSGTVASLRALPAVAHQPAVRLTSRSYVAAGDRLQDSPPPWGVSKCARRDRRNYLLAPRGGWGSFESRPTDRPVGAARPVVGGRRGPALARRAR